MTGKEPQVPNSARPGQALGGLWDTSVNAVSDYADSGRLELWGVERAIEGLASDLEVKKTSRLEKCPGWKSK